MDAKGRAVIDPTANVLQLVEAAIQRQDDLRNQEAAHLREIMELRADMATLEATHNDKLRLAEAERINAIRAVDVSAVAAAAQVSATQATTLAAQVATSAETLRNQVAAAATASTVALGAALDPIQKDIADLRRAQYEAQGQRGQVADNRTDQRGNAGLVIAAAAAVIAFVSVVTAVAAVLTR